LAPCPKTPAIADSRQKVNAGLARERRARSTGIEETGTRFRSNKS
jgi:hypothetical protein